MAFKLTDEQINGLVGKGLISTEFADNLANKKGSAQSKSIVEQADAADKELKAVPLETEMVADKTAGYYNQDGKYINEELPKSKEVPYDPNAGGTAIARPSTPDEIAQANSPEARMAAANDRAQNERHFADLNRGDANPTPIAPSAAGLAAQPNVPVPPAPPGMIGPPEAPGGTPVTLPEQTIKAAPPRVGGVGGIQLPNSDQMAMARAREANAAQSILQDRQNQIDIEGAQANSDSLDSGYQSMVKSQQEAEAKAQARYQQSQAELDELKRKSDEIANTKIDPDAHWGKGLFGSNTTANKITAGIGILLGGIGQGASRTGGNVRASNMGLDALNKTIDDDIDAQKANLANRSGQLKQRESLYARNLELFKDQNMAEIATANQYWDNAKKQVIVNAAKSDSQSVKVKADAALLEIGKRQSDLDVAFQKRKEQMAAAAAAQAKANDPKQMDYQHFLQRWRDPKDPLSRLPFEQAAGEFRQQTSKYNTFKDPAAGSGGAAAQKSVSEAQTDYENKERDYDVMEKVIEKRARGEVVSSTDKAEFDSARARLGVSIAKEAGPNATEKEVARAQEQLPDLDSYVGGRAKSATGWGVDERTRLRALRARSRANLESVRKNYGGVTGGTDTPDIPRPEERE